MSKKRKNNYGSRHGKRAEGQTTATFTLSEELKAALMEIAKSEKRTLSNFMALKAESIVAEAQAEYKAQGKAKRRPPFPRADSEEASA